jgi:CRISPR-associated endonuclease/helicase Cas3
LLVFLAAAHDLGKATPAFQFRPDIDPAIGLELRSRVLDAGFTKPAITGNDWRRAKHALASQAMLEQHEIDRSVAVVVGGHHGKPPSKAAADNAADGVGAELLGFNLEGWKTAQDELYRYALELSGVDEATLKEIRLTTTQQMVYTGIVIMSDWIASGGKDVPLPARWDVVDWDFSQKAYDFKFRFEFAPNAVQSAVIDALSKASGFGIMIIEDAMGSGKTEAALAGAEIAASAAGRSGVFFGLPTQATADGIFKRFVKWIGKVSENEPHSVFLAHGKSAHNQKYTQLRRYNVSAEDDVNDGAKYGADGDVYVNDWTVGRKKGLLADFAVGTIDQFLMCALKQKHVALRHLGLANKVIIIDEVHAYDAYMDSYLYKALRWMGEYRAPVIVLSATLPPDTRQKLIGSYLGKEFVQKVNVGTPYKPEMKKLPLPGWATAAAYPLITYTDGEDVRQICPAADLRRSVKVDIVRLENSIARVCEKLEELLADGGCAGVMVNTVRKAQDMAKELSARFGSDCVLLLHSGFINLDRTAKEAKLLRLLGPPDTSERPKKLIVVGTQVIEQSLDIDFDVLFTEICPIDLLIQRIGRLYRHIQSMRPPRLAAPVCYVMGCDEPDDGSVAVYGEYMLMTTKYLLPETLCLPEDIPRLVSAAYGDDGAEAPEHERFRYETAKQEYRKLIKDKETNAEKFQLANPTGGKQDLTDALDVEPSKHTGEATVRDGEISIEVILLRFVGGEYRLLPWIDGGVVVPTDSAPDQDTAWNLSGCKIRLPQMFSKNWNIDSTIRALEERSAVLQQAWKSNPWLNGELFLTLDEHLKTSLEGKMIEYDECLGLVVKS